MRPQYANPSRTSMCCITLFSSCVSTLIAWIFFDRHSSFIKSNASFDRPPPLAFLLKAILFILASLERYFYRSSTNYFTKQWGFLLSCLCCFKEHLRTRCTPAAIPCHLRAWSTSRCGCWRMTGGRSSPIGSNSKSPCKSRGFSFDVAFSFGRRRPCPCGQSGILCRRGCAAGWSGAYRTPWLP